MNAIESLENSIKAARGGRRNSLIALKRAVLEQQQWSEAKRKANEASVKLSSAIKEERWMDILDLAYVIKDIAFRKIHEQKKSNETKTN